MQAAPHCSSAPGHGPPAVPDALSPAFGDPQASRRGRPGLKTLCERNARGLTELVLNAYGFSEIGIHLAILLVALDTRTRRARGRCGLEAATVAFKTDLVELAGIPTAAAVLWIDFLIRAGVSALIWKGTAIGDTSAAAAHVVAAVHVARTTVGAVGVRVYALAVAEHEARATLAGGI